MSERRTRTLLRWFWAWEDDKEERFLEDMARQGWHLVRGGILFQFERGEPREMRYRLDYRRGTQGQLRDYFALCSDAGWEYVYNFGGWRYFRSPAARQAPEIYTDAASRVGKYRRVLIVVTVLLVVEATNLASLASRSQSARVLGFATALTAAVVVLLCYALDRLKRRIAREIAEGNSHQPE